MVVDTENSLIYDTALSKGEVERLVVLMEEAAEVIQAASKILRHGYYNVWPPSEEADAPNNRDKLQSEIGDFVAAYDRMVDARDINDDEVMAAVDLKLVNGAKYLHYQDYYE